MASGICHTTSAEVVRPYNRAVVAFTFLAVAFFLPLAGLLKGTHPALVLVPVAIGVAVVDAGLLMAGRRADQDIGDTLSFTVRLESGNVNEAFAAKTDQFESYLGQRRIAFRKSTAPNPAGLQFLPDTAFELPGYGVTARVRFHLEPSVMIGLKVIIGRVSDPPLDGHLRLAADFRGALLQPCGYGNVIPGLELPGHPDRNQ